MTMNYLSTVAMSDEEMAGLAKRLPMSDLVAMANHTEVHGALAVACVPHEKTFQLAVRLNAAARAEIDRRLPIPATVEEVSARPMAADVWPVWLERWEELCAALNLGALPSHEQALARAKELVALEAEDEEQPWPEADRALLTVRVLAETFGCADAAVIERVKALRSAADTLIAERDEARAEVERMRGEVAACKANGARMHDWWTALRGALGFNTAPGVTARADLQEMALCRVAEMTRELAKAKATAEQVFARWAAMCEALGYGPEYDVRSGVPTVEDVQRMALDEIRALLAIKRDVEEEMRRPFWTRTR